MKHYAIVVCSILFMVSCTEDLNKLPVIGELDTNFYQNEADALTAIAAAYDPLQYNYTTIVYHFRWFFGDFPSDDAIKGGSGQTDQPQLEELSTFFATPSNIHLNADWTAKYIGIYRANVVLEKVPEIPESEIDEGIRQRILAEAKFLRAYYYFDLVTMYGGVPMVTKVLAPSEYNQPRASATAIWSLIEQDLMEAAENLPKKSEYGSADIGRATHGAALGLLTKAYVYQSEWAAAQATAEELISSAEYSLDADFEEIFTKDGENGPGSIFEIQRSPLGGGFWGSVNGSNEGNLTNIYQIARGQFGGFGFNIPQQDLVDEFETGDPRLGSTVFKEGDVMGDRGVFTKAATGFDHDYYAKKYFVSRSEHEDINIGDPLMNGESNDRILRYADLLLMHAEAAYHNGQEGIARASLNAVRERARRNADPGILPDVTSSGPQLLDAIYHERRVELALEGIRFFDVVRQGRGAQVFGPLGFIAGMHEVFPIPQQQISLSNGTLSQNPGY